MDCALPGGISGLEATLAIKQLDGRAKVIVSSSYLEQNARNAALEHGFPGIPRVPRAPPHGTFVIPAAERLDSVSTLFGRETADTILARRKA